MFNNFNPVLPCSIIIPVHNRAALTRQCLQALLTDLAGRAIAEIVVVDDGSTDGTRELLADYGGRIRVVTHEENSGFARSCNTGAAVAAGQYLIFLNNDTLPQPGWLDALLAYAERHPGAAVIGSKLLYRNDTIQHAGVAICQDRYPRHLYAGFPADHPAVNISRRFQVVTAAAVLVRRGPFDQAEGFDGGFRNGYEDVDLCLRLGEYGHEVHYCHESVLYHLESISEGRFKDEHANARLYRDRWLHRVQPDDLQYYRDDGLLNLTYGRTYPVRFTLSPLLAMAQSDHERQVEHLLNARSQQVFELLKETTRLTVHIGELELALALAAGGERDASRSHPHQHLHNREGTPLHAPALGRPGEDRPDHLIERGDGPESMPAGETVPRALYRAAHDQLLRRDEEIQALIYDLQATVAATEHALRAVAPIGGATIDPPFTPSSHFGYRWLVAQVREVVRAVVPPGAGVVVVSKGDEALLQLDGLPAWHFPRGADGGYAGHYPHDSAAAIEHLEALRGAGGRFLVLPATAFWWLDHYADFRAHLERQHRRVVHREEICMIFALQHSEGTAARASSGTIPQAAAITSSSPAGSRGVHQPGTRGRKAHRMSDSHILPTPQA